jgi:hypothetical protein
MGKGKKPVVMMPVFRIWFGNDAGRYIQVVVKSPHFRLILAKGEDRDRTRSQEIANSRFIFL